MKTKLFIIVAIILSIPVYGICQNFVNFDSLPLGAQFGGPPLLNYPGQVICEQNAIVVSVHDFHWDATSTYFGFCEVVEAISGFGDGNIMLVNNINLQFDFVNLSPQDYWYTFEFADLGGFENLQVNGYPVIIEELSFNAPGTPAPGVTLYISTVEIPGGMKSRVILFGKVNTLLIGGQEFFLDNIEAHYGGISLQTSLVNFESPHFNTWYGGPHSNFPGQIILEEEEIPVAVTEFFYDIYTSAFNHCHIDAASSLGYGNDQVMFLNSISLEFNFTHLGNCRDRVHLGFGDLGGIENLQVNGHNLYIGELSNAPGNPVPGISWYISRNWKGSMLAASVILFGNVNSLRIGGQELILDNIRAYYYVPETSINEFSNDTVKPEKFKLCQNYPNPFNPDTEIRFQIPKSNHIMLKIYNALGQEIRTLVDAQYNVGYHSVNWDGKDVNGNAVSSGIYFYQLQAELFSQMRTMSLIR